MAFSVSSDVVRLYKTIHTWTGIVTGLILFIAFYAGALTMFKAPLTHWAAPPDTPPAMALSRADELIARTLSARPDAGKEFTLDLEGGENRFTRLTWQKSRNDATPWSSALTPAGELAIVQRHPSGLAQFVDDIHRTAGVPGDHEIGTMVTGVASALYVLALVSGVIILLPSLAKDFFAVRLGSNLKRMWMDAHNVLGIISLPFHVVIALTAVVFGLHDYFYDSLDHMVYEGRMKSVMEASNPLNRVNKDKQAAVMLAAEELLARTRNTAPGFKPVSLQYRDAGTTGATVRVWGHDSRYLVRGRGFVVLSAVTGAVMDTEYLPGHQGGWSATVSSFFALHFGSFGGDAVQWGYFFLGLAGAFLFYSGNLLWIESRRRTERRHGGSVIQTRAASLMAAGTVGVCMGCVCGLSLTIVAGKWLDGVVADTNMWHGIVYYTVFLGGCAWAFGRGAARGGADLLWLATAAAAAIPLTTLVALLLPSLGIWVARDTDGYGVDAVAAVSALGFAWMARATGLRAKNGPRDSVWSEHKRPLTETAG